MNKEEAIAAMRAGYRVQYLDSGAIRWMDRDGTAWVSYHEGLARVPHGFGLVSDGYNRLPFTRDDAHRWLNQGGWLIYGPSSGASEEGARLGSRFRFDALGQFVCLRGFDHSSSHWTATVMQGIDDYFAPIDPNANLVPPVLRSRTRFEIIEDL